MAGSDWITEVAEGVFLVDVGLFGRPGLGGVYVLAGAEAAIVETGTSLSAPRIVAALAELGIPRGRVRWIFLTHIHLDHAGGAGALLPELPNAQVVVHRRGAKHLINPSRLVESVRQAVGERFPLYGEAIPIPEERIVVPEDGERFPVGAHLVRAIDSPGHAPHHLCYLEEAKGLLFTGDAAGLYLGGKLLPTTPPPSFDLELSLATLKRLQALKPRALLFTHFGIRQGDATLAEYERLLPAWVNTVARALKSGVSGNEELAGFLSDAGWPADDPRFRDDLLMSARGAEMYLEKRGADRG